MRSGKFTTFTRFSLLGGLLGILSGCATEKIVPLPYPSSANPNQEIETLQTRMLEDAGDKDVDVLSKKNYLAAQEALRDAKQLRNQGQSKEAVFERLSDARAYLHYAETRAEVARRLLKDARETRSTAVALDAGTYFLSELEKIDVKYLEMARAIEEGDDSVSAEDQASLVQNYHRLTVQAVRTTFLPESIRIITEAQEDGAAERAPKTLALVQRDLVELDRQIHEDVTNTEKIQELSSKTEERANLLYRMVQKSNEAGNITPEETLFENETSAPAVPQVTDALTSPPSIPVPTQ